MRPLLQLINLSVQFREEQQTTLAVNNISLDIESGRITAIVGESGSGKSVTALSVLQLLPQKADVTGEILFHTEGEKAINLAKISSDDINNWRGRKISMIFQEPMTSLNPLLTCGYQVMEMLIAHQKISKKEAERKTIELFREVELPNPENIFSRYPHQISGGQKQRVMIAMAISCKPALLIADEPTTALDVIVQKNIITLLKKLQQNNGMAILLITHDLGLVAEVADKIVVMRKAEIIETGVTKDVLTKPTHDYTKELIACRPHLYSKGKKLPAIVESLSGQQMEQAFIKKTITTEATDNTPALSVQQLKVYFPEKKNLWGKPKTFFKAVDEVSFDVMSGETIGLAGESGCGKSTLGKTIMQLIRPTAGKIFLQGTELTAGTNGKNTHREIQIVFQDPYGSLNPRLTIGEAITEPMKVHKIFSGNKQRKESAAEWLRRVNINPDNFNRYPHQFSGGQRQRICIARALAVDPSFLIFDESIAALDLSIQAQILNLINELKSTYGFTSIFISHDLSVLHYISDRMMVMKNGKIIEAGTADQIYTNPRHPYTRQLIDAIPGKSAGF